MRNADSKIMQILPNPSGGISTSATTKSQEKGGKAKQSEVGHIISQKIRDH
jgi:hypothetical protein